MSKSVGLRINVPVKICLINVSPFDWAIPAKWSCEAPCRAISNLNQSQKTDRQMVEVVSNGTTLLR